MEILAIVGTLLGFVIWLVKRKASKADDPKEQLKGAYREIDQAISKGDAGIADINRMVADMERVQDASGSNTSEQGNQIRRDELHSSSCCNANPVTQPSQGNGSWHKERLNHEPNTK